MAAWQMSQKELSSVILMQSMFAAKNLRAQRDRLVDFQYQLQKPPIAEVPPGFDAVSMWNRLLLCKLHHNTGDTMEEILPSLDELTLHDRLPRPQLQLHQQAAGESIEDVFPGFDEVSMSNRLKELELQLQQSAREAPEGYPVEEVVSGLAEVRFHGLAAAAGYLNMCLNRAAQNGARLAPNPSFSDEQKLFDALKAAQRLPARPTTQAEAISRIQATLYAVKWTQEHLLRRCMDHLKPTSDLATPAANPQAAGSSRSMEPARDTLDDAYIILNLAIKHVDLAIAAMSPFVHPTLVAGHSRFADNYTTFGWDELRVTMLRAHLRRRR